MNRLEALQELTKDLGWVDIDTLARLAQDAGLYNEPEFRQNALIKAIKVDLRATIRKLKDDSGLPIFASIKVPDGEGEEREIYKQEALFDVEDYKQVCQYHVERGIYHLGMARRYEQRCYERYKVQLALSFPDDAPAST